MQSLLAKEELSLALFKAWNTKEVGEEMLCTVGKKINEKYGNFDAAAADASLWEGFKDEYVKTGKKWASNIKARLLLRWAFPGHKAVDDGRYYKFGEDGKPVFDKERTEAAKKTKAKAAEEEEGPVLARRARTGGAVLRAAPLSGGSAAALSPAPKALAGGAPSAAAEPKALAGGAPSAEPCTTAAPVWTAGQPTHQVVCVVEGGKEFYRIERIEGAEGVANGLLALNTLLRYVYEEEDHEFRVHSDREISVLIKDHYLTCGKCEERVEPADYFECPGAGGNASADGNWEGLIACSVCEKLFGACCGSYDPEKDEQHCSDDACAAWAAGAAEPVAAAPKVANAGGAAIAAAPKAPEPVAAAPKAPEPVAAAPKVANAGGAAISPEAPEPAVAEESKSEDSDGSFLD